MKRRRFLQLAGLTAAACVPAALRSPASFAGQADDAVYWLAVLPMLSTIAAAEGTLHLKAKGYQTTFAYQSFTGWKHPRRDIPIPGDPRNRTSDAAGMYQITSTTLADMRRLYPNAWLDEPEFSPGNQDRAAMALLDHCGASASLLAGVRQSGGHVAISYAAFKKAIHQASIRWAAFPGHDIGKNSGQRTKTIGWLWTEYQWHLWGRCGYRRHIVAPLPKMVETSPYGWRWGRLHRGIDYAAAIGTPLKAPEDCKIVKVKSDNRSGLYVIARHVDYPEIETLYCHLDSAAVKVGDVVGSGQVFATTGATGKVTGPHLHTETWIGDDSGGWGVINPHRYWKMNEWFPA